ncbi:cellulose biosynthesis protein BcsE [Erwiniaceae bacterium BAC15a-03b]|uniref:Cellulose biosynthesis protein BcsE n=1 Tax=Winslowiella arboricola TaxID=2978220 RepID=A0A9J6PUM8_9GAMM|nr:cellulose biosynthesis protein BcsE [Winslowiella arboricola]MCU5773833.1 cellulose biosynthesis protein BcsE [Winslowiella arboricola]MCU5777743.1 cellulose biosynthesis protein BcsE [Winslowiella arboricola]
MTLSFTLGIAQLQDELTQMQAPGCYWITSDRQPDARMLARQVIGAQQKLTLISNSETPQALLTPAPAGDTLSIPMYSLPAGRKGLLNLPEDLARLLSARPRLILLYSAYASWQSLTAAEIAIWLKKMTRLLAEKNSTLLIISAGTGVNNLRNQLQRFFHQLDGMAHLEWQQDRWDYRINWWCSGNQLFADRVIRLDNRHEKFGLLNDAEPGTPLTLSDEQQFIAQRDVLEGAQPLSRQWQLFDHNDEVYSRAQQASSATVLFSLSDNQQIPLLAESIHFLRRTRGSALKIVVRELETSMRNSDERLLLACGVNSIIPYGTNLSDFLTALEGLQGQSYNRHVPADLQQLMASMQPLHEKGFLPPARFYAAVQLLVQNTLLPENGKGLLVALRPVPELQPQQALTLCKMRRFGDLVTLIDDRLYLFLFSCRFNDLDTALKYIFSLPYNEIFANRMVWYEDLQIASEIRQIKALIPTAWRNAAPESEAAETVALQERAPVVRRVPQAITLGVSAGQGRVK